jgi:hypothetical protein
MITVPTGVLSIVISFCFQLSEPGATPGQTFTVCARAMPVAQTKASAQARA